MSFILALDKQVVCDVLGTVRTSKLYGLQLWHDVVLEGDIDGSEEQAASIFRLKELVQNQC
jgi:hypothetical protein